MKLLLIIFGRKYNKNIWTILTLKGSLGGEVPTILISDNSRSNRKPTQASLVSSLSERRHISHVDITGLIDIGNTVVVKC